MVFTFVYADDTVLLGASPAALQQLINYCVKFAGDDEIFYNLKKTKCMCIRLKSMKDVYFPKLYLSDKVVQVVDNEKYLGSFISKDLSDDDDILRQMRSIYGRGNVLIHNFRNCSHSIKAMLLNIYCTGLYGSSLWCSYKVKTLHKIRIAYNNVFRILMGLSRQGSVSKAMLDMNIDWFQVVCRKHFVGFISRLDKCDNNIVKTLYDWIDFSQLLKTWIDKAFC